VATTKTATIEIEKVNHPGSVKRGNEAMYEAMKRAFLKILPKTSPGLTEAEIRVRVIAHLPAELFPEGAKAGGGRRPFSLIWRPRVFLRERKPSHSAGARRDLDSRLADRHPNEKSLGLRGRNSWLKKRTLQENTPVN
jgi:hypothetical protein